MRSRDSSLILFVMAFWFRVMLHSRTILQHFYKLLMWPTSYWFSSRPTINNTFSFTILQHFLQTINVAYYI